MSTQWKSSTLYTDNIKRWFVLNSFKGVAPIGLLQNWRLKILFYWIVTDSFTSSKIPLLYKKCNMKQSVKCHLNAIYVEMISWKKTKHRCQGTTWTAQIQLLYINLTNRWWSRVQYCAYLWMDLTPKDVHCRPVFQFLISDFRRARRGLFSKRFITSFVWSPRLARQWASPSSPVLGHSWWCSHVQFWQNTVGTGCGVINPTLQWQEDT